MNTRELRAYRERQAAEFAKLSTAALILQADRERSGKVMIGRNLRVRLAPKTDRAGLGVARSEYRDHSWSGVPQNMPDTRRPRRRAYSDPTYKPEPQPIREPENVFASSPAMFVADIRATDVKGKSDRFFGLRKPFSV